MTPILDNENKVIKVLDLFDKIKSKLLFSYKQNIQVVIKTWHWKRMQPYTHVIPKPLLPIQKPMIEHVWNFSESMV